MAKPQIYAQTTLWRTQVINQLGTGDLDPAATSGFFYLPAVNGVPVGTPADLPGFVATAIDPATGILYAYISGAWQAV